MSHPPTRARKPLGEQLSEALCCVADELDHSREELRGCLAERDQKTQVLLEQIKTLLIDQREAFDSFRSEMRQQVSDLERDVAALKRRSSNGSSSGVHL